MQGGQRKYPRRPQLVERVWTQPSAPRVRVRVRRWPRVAARGRDADLREGLDVQPDGRRGKRWCRGGGSIHRCAAGRVSAVGRLCRGVKRTCVGAACARVMPTCVRPITMFIMCCFAHRQRTAAAHRAGGATAPGAAACTLAGAAAGVARGLCARHAHSPPAEAGRQQRLLIHGRGQLNAGVGAERQAASQRPGGG